MRGRGGTNHGCRRWSGGGGAILAGDHRRRDMHTKCSFHSLLIQQMNIEILAQFYKAVDCG